MAFDPNIPAAHTRIKAGEMRAQFNALKALIDALTTQVAALQAQVSAYNAQFVAIGVQLNALAELVPVGAVIAWVNGALAGVPALPANFAECNGQVLNDAESPFDGQTLPDMNNTKRFLRGASISGNSGGAETHSHDVDLSGTSAGDPGASGGSTVPWGTYVTSESSLLPPYYEVVYVMRVK